MILIIIKFFSDIEELFELLILFFNEKYMKYM